MIAQFIVVALMVLYVVTLLRTISLVGRERKPVTSQQAVRVAAWALIYVAGLAYVLTQLRG